MLTKLFYLFQTCAHRYKELKQTRGSVNIYGIGSCYQLTQELAYNAALGQGNQIRPCQGLSKAQEHEEYAFCQSGISAFITEVSIVHLLVSIVIDGNTNNMISC